MIKGQPNAYLVQPVNKLCNGLKQDYNYCMRLNCLKFLACPARFERATYALEEFVVAGISLYFNMLQGKKTSISYRTLPCDRLHVKPFLVIKMSQCCHSKLSKSKFYLLLEKILCASPCQFFSSLP